MPVNVASDMFASLGAQWSFQTADVMTVVSGELRANAIGNASGAWRNDIGPNGQWQFSKFAVGTVIDSVVDLGMGPAVCMADAADTSYACLVNSNAAGRFQLVRRNAGAQTVLKNYTVVAPATGNILWLVKDPTYHLYVFLNGLGPAFEIISFDDSASASKLETGRVGAFGRISIGVSTLDNFEGGDWPYAQRQSPNAPMRGGYSVQ